VLLRGWFKAGALLHVNKFMWGSDIIDGRKIAADFACRHMPIAFYIIVVMFSIRGCPWLLAICAT
jgi:hypothetical protein